MDSEKSTVDAGNFAFPYVHSLNHLDTIIPAKVQRGLATVDLGFTCIDATSNHIAIGTTAGICYLFDRRCGEIQKLRCEDMTKNPITCIRCLETVELMIAIGMCTGVIAIFQIPLYANSQNNNSNRLEKYLLNDVHARPLTYLEWSRNGMKMFSGDESGVVAQTDIDFSARLCKSAMLLQEAHPIVQLVYEQRMLLVSTRQRTFVFNGDSEVKQTGQRERKSLGNFGACFHVLPEKPNEMLVLASRPALRLWKANVDGKVLETFIFKDGALQDHQMLSVAAALNSRPPASANRSAAECQFGILRNFIDNHVLTYNPNAIYLLAVSEPTIVKKCDGLGYVVSVAPNADEIFVLSGKRSIVRISSSLDETILRLSLIREESFLPSLKFMPNALKDFEFKLKGTSNLMTTSIFGMIKPMMVNPTANKGFHAESEPQNGEMDIPRVNARPIEWPITQNTEEDDVSASTNNEERAGSELSPAFSVDRIPKGSELWAPLADSEDEPTDEGAGIVFEQRVRKRGTRRTGDQQKINDAVDSTSTDSADSPCSEDGAVISPEPESHDQEPVAAVSVMIPGSDLTFVRATDSSNSREEKEILLAQMLDLKELLPEELQVPQQGDQSDFFNLGLAVGWKMDQATTIADGWRTDMDAESGGDRQSPVEDADPERFRSEESSVEFDIYRTNFSHCSNDDDDEDEDAPSHPSSDSNSYLSYGPPSGSSNMNSMGSMGGRSLDPPQQLPRPHSMNACPEQDVVAAGSGEVNRSPEPKPEMEVKYNDFWVQHKPPGYMRSLAVCEHYIVCTDAKDTVYYSSFEGLGLEWHRTDYQASQICLSNSGKRVWRIHRNSAYALVQPSIRGPFGKNWVEVVLNAKNVSVADTCVWYVTKAGSVFAQTGMDDNQTYSQSKLVEYSSKIAQVTCAYSSVWALTVDNALICRLGITAENPIGSEWTRVGFEAGTGTILTAALGSMGTVWVIDNALNIWFKSGLTPKVAPQGTGRRWWQVQISDYIYQNVSTLRNLTSSLMDTLNPDQFTTMMYRGCPCVVSTKSKGTWFYHTIHHQLYTNQTDIIGHHWSRISINLSKMPVPKWRVMTAAGVYRHHGVIFLWQPGVNTIFCLNPTSMRGSSVKLPLASSPKESLCISLQCLSASPESLWLLTKSGEIFIRKGIAADNAAGDNWEKLDLTQIAKHKLIHISCGSNLVWACDCKGAILMRIGSLQPPSIHNLQPAWVLVDDSAATEAAQQQQPSATFVKVYVGPLDYTVWAIDSKCNVYVREGIFPELLIGLGWVPVAGIQATHLAISEHAVYALTPNRMIYRRYNISRNNYIGDYWMNLPGRAEQLSVTVDDKLWALNNNQQLIQHLEHGLSGTGKKAKEKPAVALPVAEQLFGSSNEEDWELIESCS